jgi:hypothetical protein
VLKTRKKATILYQNEFQNPQIFQQTIRLFPELSTLVGQHYWVPQGILQLYVNVFQNPVIFTSVVTFLLI